MTIYGLVEKLVDKLRQVIPQISLDEHNHAEVAVREPIDEQGRVQVAQRDLDEDLIAVTGVIDTGTDTPPVTIITPSQGKKIDIRRAFIATDSTSGEIYIKFATTNKIATVIFPSRFGYVVIPAIRIPGEANEAVTIDWSGLSGGSKIFYAVNYKEI